MYGGAPGDHWRRKLHAGEPVFCNRHPESGGNHRNFSSAGSADGSFHDAPVHGTAGQRRRTGHSWEIYGERASCGAGKCADAGGARPGKGGNKPRLCT